MKSLILVLVLTACGSSAAVAQDSILKKRLSFKIWVTGIDSIKTVGWLSAISDSALELSARRKHFNDTREIANNRISIFTYNQMDVMTLKRVNAAGRGAVIGAVCGLVIGAIAGFASGDDPPASQDAFGFGGLFRMTAAEKGLTGGIVGAGAGAGLGALTGALIKEIFIIGGKKEKFSEMRMNIIDRAYIK